ncbi:unnamed protein product [Lymnaea stagnalis]|uniref:G-protein coupled receptors family 1 profile domain-containing protein n=1 Tax=Lymnaea stagnalis TaxID=6523 RepID=A0AAV2I3B8_LYMST
MTLVIFWKTGLADGISVCFFSLTVSDLFCLALFLASTVLAILDVPFHVRPYVSFYWVCFILPFYALLFYNTSTLTTVFLTVQKCCCVVLPLKFKDAFSRARCAAVNVCIYCVVSVTFIPFTMTVVPFHPGFDPTTNSTRLMFYLSSFFSDEVLPAIKAINYVSIPIVSEISVFFCTLLLTVRLQQSLKFRSSGAVQSGAANRDYKIGTRAKEGAENSSVIRQNVVKRFLKSDCGSETTRVSWDTPSDIKADGDVAFEDFRKPSKINPMSSTKERRATQAVKTVALIFVLANSPDVIVYLTNLVVPEFSASYRNTYRLCIELQDLLHVINMSVNIFVYLKFNSKFLRTFRATYGFLLC